MNTYGMYTLYLKETRRFLKVYHQTIFSPMITALLLLAVFVLSSKGRTYEVKNVAFIDFIGYGLIIMSMTQQAFANTSSSFIMSKVIGYISDLLIPPLQGLEIVSAYTFAAVTRSLIVGFAVAIALVPFVKVTIHSFGLFVFFSLASSSMLAMLGILTGLISKSFDHTYAVTNYLINPLSFLSGTFYSTKHLPQILQTINLYNPFFYMIDGFRYSIIGGVPDSNIRIGVCVLFLINTLLFFLLKHLIDIGWRLKT